MNGLDLLLLISVVVAFGLLLRLGLRYVRSEYAATHLPEVGHIYASRDNAIIKVVDLDAVAEVVTVQIGRVHGFKWLGRVRYSEWGEYVREMGLIRLYNE